MNGQHTPLFTSHEHAAKTKSNGTLTCWDFAYRWWLAAPGDDETLRSLVERADRLYGVPPEEAYVWQDIGGGGHGVDSPSSYELLRLASMLGVSARRLVAHRLRDHPALLDSTERRAYCPRCIQEDRVDGRPRAFRRAWARFFLLHCPRHDVPLQWAEPRLAAISDPILHQALKPPEADALEVLQLIHAFAQTLEACLWQRRTWPTQWRGSAHTARAFLIRTLSNVTGEHAAPAAAQLWLPTEWAPWITFPSRAVPPMDTAPWNSVRRVGRPAWRRAGLWLTAWQVIPRLPERLRPPTIPENYLDESDAWWEKVGRGVRLTRLGRLHTALRATCQMMPIGFSPDLPPRPRRSNSPRTRE